MYCAVCKRALSDDEDFAISRGKPLCIDCIRGGKSGSQVESCRHMSN